MEKKTINANNVEIVTDENNDELAINQFGAEPTRLILSLSEDKTLEERKEISNALETSFADYGMQVYVIEEEVIDIQSLIFAIFSILGVSPKPPPTFIHRLLLHYVRSISRPNIETLLINHRDLSSEVGGIGD